MKYIVGASTDIGTTKSTNQDSLIVKAGRCQDKNVILAVLCDGMGGLQKGELASAITVDRFSKWLTERLPVMLKQQHIFENVREEWDRLLNSLNNKFNEYGRANSVNIGTTVTGILIIENQYLIVNVGDSRTYLLSENITQITEDQSLVAQEIRQGRLTEEQAKNDPRRNVLFQCIGATPSLEIEYYRGNVSGGMGFLLCSDGLRHMVSAEEIFNCLNPVFMSSEEIIKERLDGLVGVNMERGETDNITAAYIKVVHE